MNLPQTVDTPAEQSFVSPGAAARSMLSKHWHGELPVSPFQIARASGLTVATMSNVDCSGRFLRAQKTIFINIDEPEVRQRFTAAHELGHFALGHGDALRDTPDAFSSRSTDPIERAANQFAAELLMPAELVRTLVKSGRFTSADELARAFRVSKVAMTYRINNLGFLAT